MYASHRDACILSLYSHRLDQLLNAFYLENDLNEVAIAYRALGLGNYDHAATAFKFAVNHAPCMIIALDVSGFFDNLDHLLLKTRLKQILGVESLPEDWYRIFKFVAKFHFVELRELGQIQQFADRLGKRGSEPIGTVADLKKAGVNFYSNKRRSIGIPQGTPISAALSNLYLMDFDIQAKTYCDSKHALYRRYSDDILVICRPEDAIEVESKFRRLIEDEKLQLSEEKTEKILFDPAKPHIHEGRIAQYLGFSFYPSGVGIRPGSLSRQWRKMKRSLRRVRRIAQAAADAGGKPKVYTKTLRRRFSAIQVRNFSSYARRSAVAFGPDQKITSQIRKLERVFEREVRALKRHFNNL